MGLKHELRKLLRRFGYDISRVTPLSHAMALRKTMLGSYDIDTVLDVGANAGQFALALRREAGYTGRILSFEPLSAAYELLKENAKGDPDWEVFRCAIGDAEGNREINIAGNSYSSSLLDMLPSHLKSAPESRYVGKELIDVRTLDSLFENVRKNAGNVYLKIDTQGFESRVLAGAEKSLAFINTVEMEMALVPLYDGELLFHEMCLRMRSNGYTLVALENEFSDPVSGQLLQVDGIFHRFVPLGPAIP